MKNRGALLLLIMGLFLILLYFSFFGFSRAMFTRWGQYTAIGAICLFIIDEAFKQQ
jgi:hypothetical protein